jgi:hypothetical protein
MGQALDSTSPKKWLIKSTLAVYFLITKKFTPQIWPVDKRPSQPARHLNAYGMVRGSTLQEIIMWITCAKTCK